MRNGFALYNSWLKSKFRRAGERYIKSTKDTIVGGNRGIIYPELGNVTA